MNAEIVRGLRELKRPTVLLMGGLHLVLLVGGLLCIVFSPIIDVLPAGWDWERSFQFYVQCAVGLSLAITVAMGGFSADLCLGRERDRGTIDFLRISGMGYRELATGLLIRSQIPVLLATLAGVPLLMLACAAASIPMTDVADFALMLVTGSFLFGSLGLFASLLQSNGKGAGGLGLISSLFVCGLPLLALGAAIRTESLLVVALLCPASACAPVFGIVPHGTMVAFLGIAWHPALLAALLHLILGTYLLTAVIRKLEDPARPFWSWGQFLALAIGADVLFFAAMPPGLSLPELTGFHQVLTMLVLLLAILIFDPEAEDIERSIWREGACRRSPAGALQAPWRFVPILGVAAIQFGTYAACTAGMDPAKFGVCRSEVAMAYVVLASLACLYSQASLSTSLALGGNAAVKFCLLVLFGAGFIFAASHLEMTGYGEVARFLVATCFLVSPASAMGWLPLPDGSSIAVAWPRMLPCALLVQCTLIAVLAIPVAAWTRRRTARIERVRAALVETQRGIAATGG